jgi:transposase
MLPDQAQAQQGGGYTVADIARRFRVGEDKVRGWIARGELIAVNTAATLCGRPRWVVTVESLAVFERGRTTAQPAKTVRRKRQTGTVDFYPD